MDRAPGEVIGGRKYKLTRGGAIIECSRVIRLIGVVDFKVPSVMGLVEGIYDDRVVEFEAGEVHDVYDDGRA